tara:strand:+ start:157 stop:636 length:480 start_codon:yes stop_codon:yes gene_type:complete
MRTFIALDIPDEVKDKITEIQNELQIEGKLTKKENIHLTLKFLGDVHNVDDIKKQLRNINHEQFTATIDEIGTFSNRIIWLHLNNVDELQKKIDNILPFPKENRFMSHITIARPKKIIKIPNINKITFQIKSFSLQKSILTSEGPIYETLERFPLQLKK